MIQNEFPYHITGKGKHNKATNAFTLKFLNEMGQKKIPQTVVDVGAGDGFFGKLIKYLFPSAKVLGVELCDLFVKEYKLHEMYDVLVKGDILEVYPFLRGDLIIFGDVLEHLSSLEIVQKVLTASVQNFSYVFISSPVGFQETSYVQKEDKHLCGFTREDIQNFDIWKYEQIFTGKYDKMCCLINGIGKEDDYVS